MPLSLNALPPQGQEILKLLIPFPFSDFYLAGGTGLALQIGHRVSVDFDFFSQGTSLDLSDRLKMQNVFSSRRAALEIQREENGTFILLVKEVRLSFFSYPYPLIEPIQYIDGIPLASLRDIGAMKIAAIISRGSRRDFLDLYEITQRVPLIDLLGKASRKYERVADFPFQALKALVFFEDAEAEPMPQLLKPIPWEEVRYFFEGKVDELSGMLG